LYLTKDQRKAAFISLIDDLRAKTVLQMQGKYNGDALMLKQIERIREVAVLIGGDLDCNPKVMIEAGMGELVDSKILQAVALNETNPLRTRARFCLLRLEANRKRRQS
jgi:hypothetical protein